MDDGWVGGGQMDPLKQQSFGFPFLTTDTKWAIPLKSAHAVKEIAFSSLSFTVKTKKFSHPVV